jgi:glycosyltransferase involved in cell wall biosynthesis
MTTSNKKINQTHAKPSVLFVARFLWGDDGISSHLATLATGLMKQGWEIAIASGMPEEAEANRESTFGSKYFEALGVQWFIVPFPQFRFSTRNAAYTFKSLQKLNTVIRQFRPDVIHAHSISVCPYLNIMRLWYQIPFVTTCHMDIKTKKDRSEVKLSAFIGKYSKSFIGDRAIAVSSELKDGFKAVLKVSQENIRLIFYGIEDDRFRIPSPEERVDVREAFQLNLESKVVCLLGRLAPVKGHGVLFRAISILRSQGTVATALCAGKGDEEAVREQAVEAGVSDLVRLPGFADARQVLWASEVIALPSRREALPLVIPEAMLCGIVPVRTPAAGAFDQIEDGVDGFIVPFDDPEALASRLKQLLENEQLRSKMSAAALESARRKFTADRMTKDVISVYEEVIDERS